MSVLTNGIELSVDKQASQGSRLLDMFKRWFEEGKLKSGFILRIRGNGNFGGSYYRVEKDASLIALCVTTGVTRGASIAPEQFFHTHPSCRGWEIIGYDIVYLREGDDSVLTDMQKNTRARTNGVFTS